MTKGERFALFLLVAAIVAASTATGSNSFGRIASAAKKAKTRGMSSCLACVGRYRQSSSSNNQLPTSVFLNKF